MTMLLNRTLIAPLILAATAIIAGCATSGTDAPLKSSIPADANPARPVADFGASLRCMDNLLADFAVGRVTLDVTGVADQTSNAVHRERLIAALSNMSVRSRAIRVVADADRVGRSVDSPVFWLRGAVGSDEMQLSVISGFDSSIVPGVDAHNGLIRMREGSGSRTTTEIRTLGQRFELPPGTDESRALAEISAIELVGKLAKVPYWSCIGATDREDAVAAEIQDWFDGMVEHPAEIITYFQKQMRASGIYQGPISGTVNPEFKDAVARYREALGLSHEAKFSLDFFQAYLSADHREISGRLQAAAGAPAAPSPEVEVQPAPPVPTPASLPAEALAPPAERVATSAVVPTGPLAVHVVSANGARRFTKGEVVQFNVWPNREAHVYCYLQDEDHNIRLVFPNRFRRDSLVEADGGLQLPGAMGFEISMSGKGAQQALLCFASPRDIFGRLSARVAGRDLEPLAAHSLEEVRHAYATASGGELAADQFYLPPR
jgi:hypothetical protein